MCFRTKLLKLHIRFYINLRGSCSSSYSLIVPLGSGWSRRWRTQSVHFWWILVREQRTWRPEERKTIHFLNCELAELTSYPEKKHFIKVRLCTQFNDAGTVRMFVTSTVQKSKTQWLHLTVVFPCLQRKQPAAMWPLQKHVLSHW